MKQTKTPTATKTDGGVRWKSAILNQTIGKTRSEVKTPIKGGIYVHVPFCRNKCAYCHFYILPYDEKRIDCYLEALELEWQMRKIHLDEVQTLYIGGGTPSLLSAKEVERILKFLPSGAKEITIEANPEDITLEKMQDYLSLGIDRVSIGVQTLNNNLLQILDRKHTSNRSIQAIETTHKAGFTNISIDLMYDLPNQRENDFRESLNMAAKLPITHLSLYNLTFEKGSLFYKHQASLSKQLPSDEESLHMIEDAVMILEKAGLKRYEISAFAKDGFASKHNTSYWLGTPFIGLGPSAFSYTYGSRHQNIANISKWQTKLKHHEDPTDFCETLPYPNNILELIAIRLRLLEGIDLTDFPPIPKSAFEALEKAVLDGLLEQTDSHFRLTKKGTLFYDTLASTII